MSQIPTTPTTPQVAMPAKSRMRRVFRFLLPALVVAAILGVWQRERLWVWYCAERLEYAAEEDRANWSKKLADAGEPALPTLLALLRHDDANVCVNSRSAILAIAGTWSKQDDRRTTFVANFFDAEPRFSTPGRAAGLDLLPIVIESASPETMARAKTVVVSASKSEAVYLRLQAVAAAMNRDMNCLDAIVPLLGDPATEVRRAAVLALGPMRDDGVGATDDDLLRCLHDEDAEVRQLCEMGLRSRGRTPRDIRLGRRYAAPNPAERQKLLIDLAHEEELDVTVWLDRLTADPDPAVRAGAARLAVDRGVNLGARLDQMSQSDPDGTVRRIAGYYRQKALAQR